MFCLDRDITCIGKGYVKEISDISTEKYGSVMSALLCIHQSRPVFPAYGLVKKNTGLKKKVFSINGNILTLIEAEICLFCCFLNPFISLVTFVTYTIPGYLSPHH